MHQPSRPAVLPSRRPGGAVKYRWRPLGVATVKVAGGQSGPLAAGAQREHLPAAAGVREGSGQQILPQGRGPTIGGHDGAPLSGGSHEGEVAGCSCRRLRVTVRAASSAAVAAITTATPPSWFW